MSDEQREILQMVSDGKISADDGVKLLEALDKGREKRREMESPAKRIRRKKRMMFGKDMPPAKMGHMLMSVVHDAMNGIKHDMDEPDRFDFDFEGSESVPFEGDIELEEGTELLLKRSRRYRGRPGDLVLVGVDGGTCRVVSGSRSGVTVDREDNIVRIRLGEGDQVLEVPSTVKKVAAEITGGDLISKNLGASVRLRSKGGDIVLLDTRSAFDAKTMGGDLMITLAEDWREDSRVSTMGGNITLGVRSETPGEVTARTMGGTIEVSESLGESDASDRPGSSRIKVTLTENDDSPTLRMKTMGGDITIGLAEELEDPIRHAAEMVIHAREMELEEGPNVLEARDEELKRTDEELKRKEEELRRTDEELKRTEEELLEQEGTLTAEDGESVEDE